MRSTERPGYVIPLKGSPSHFIHPDGTVDDEKMEAERGRWRRFSPLRMTGQPEDIASAALFLASDACRYLTGQVLHRHGGGFMP